MSVATYLKILMISHIFTSFLSQ